MKDLRVIYLNSDKIVKLGFGSTNSVNTITGMTSLLQRILYYLYTEVGSNFSTPKLGSKFSTINKLNWSPDSEGIIKAAITSSIVEIEDKVKKDQLQESNLSPDEILDTLTIQELSYNSSSQAWKIYINLITASNKTFTVTI